MKKLTNEDLKEAVSLEAMIKDATKRLDEIKDAAKAQGSFATKEYVVAVSEQSRTALAGLADVKKAIGEDILVEHDLIKIHKYQIVKIVKKEAA